MKLGMVIQTYNPSIEVALAGGSQVPGQSGLNGKTLPQNKTHTKS
jgi:hypothetical protein